MKQYTDLEDKYAQYQGGFIWDYIDQAVYYTNGYGEKEFLVMVEILKNAILIIISVAMELFC